jgi:O-Antigen ligase
MFLIDALSILIIISGIFCLHRPIILLYLFTALPVLSYLPIISEYNKSLRLVRIGSINIYAQDYLVIITIILIVSFSIYYLFTNKKFVFILYASPITKIVIFLLIWEFIIGIISYIKGFELQNVLRSLSVDSLMIISIFIPFIKKFDISKELFFKYTIFLGYLLFFLAFWRFAVTKEYELTSSMTRRTILGNTVVIFLFPLCYTLFYKKNYKKNIFISFTTVLLLFLGINFSGHRSGYLAFLFVIGIWMSKKNYFNKDLIWIPIIGFVSLFFLFILLPLNLNNLNQINHKQNFFNDILIRYLDTFNLENKTTVERISKWQYSIEIAKNRPLFGLARIPYYTGVVSDKDNKVMNNFSELDRAPHNIIFNKVIHQGIVGLIIFALFILVIIIQINRISFYNPNFELFLKSYVYSFILFSMFNTTLSNPVGLTYFSITLGLLNYLIINNICDLKS